MFVVWSRLGAVDMSEDRFTRQSFTVFSSVAADCDHSSAGVADGGKYLATQDAAFTLTADSETTLRVLRDPSGSQRLFITLHVNGNCVCEAAADLSHSSPYTLRPYMNVHVPNTVCVHHITVRCMTQ